MTGPASKGLDVLAGEFNDSELKTEQLPTDREPVPGELPKPVVREKEPKTVLSTRVVPDAMLVVWLTMKPPSLMVPLALKAANRSGGTAVLESEHVLPLAAIGIVTELLTMLPLTIKSET
jgi:hypothetical protein